MTERTYPEALALTCDLHFEFAAPGEGDGEDGKDGKDGKKLPRVSMLAYAGGPMRLASWLDPVVIDLSGLALPTQQVPLRLAHSPFRLVGHSDEVKVEDGQLHAAGVISFETADAKAVVTSAKNGFPWQASVGVAEVTRVEFLDEGESTTVNGQTVTGPVDIVRKGTLKEISFVDLGADSHTSATVAARVAAGDDAMTKDTKNTDAGPVAAPDSPPAPAPAVQATDPVETDQVIQAARTERRRRSKIAEMVQAALELPGSDIDRIEKIGREAIDGGWAERDTELALLKASRPTAPAAHVRGGPPSEQTLVASLLLSCGVDADWLAKDRDIGEQAVEAGWKRRQMGLHELFATCLRANGNTPPDNKQELYRAVIECSIQAGFSTVNLAGILGTAGNKLLLDSFTSVNATYPRLAQQTDLDNFLQYTMYRLDHVGAFSKVDGTGELKHGSYGEDSYTNQLETRGQMLTLSRQQIINDDLNAFQQLYSTLGRKAAIAVEKALYEQIMESSDVFYTAARGNRNTSSALAIATLAAGEAAMLALVDTDGEPIYAQPKILLVPPELKYLADQFYTSAMVSADGSATLPMDNPFRGRFAVESSPYLSLSTMTGYSPTTWYFLADPDLLPAFQVAYLKGARQPTVETADAAFNTLGIQMRGYFDFGVAQVDYKGAQKNSA